MSIWKFILISASGEETEVDNPLGWEDVQCDIKRDEKWHGIFFSYAFSKLQFYGEGAYLIKTEYEAKGVDGDMEMSVLFQCSDGENYDEFYRGRLSFDEYEDTCGDECLVTIGLQDSNDIMLMRNNYEQKVNINSNLAFDQITELTEYDKLNSTLLIPNRGLTQRVSGASDGTDFQTIPEAPIRLINPLGTFVYIRPSFTVNTVSEINDSDLVGYGLYKVSPDQLLHPTTLGPVLTLKDQVNCYNELFSYSIRMKGAVREETSLNRLLSIYAVVNQGQAFNGNPSDPVLGQQTIIHEQNVAGGTQSNTPFDVTISGQVLLNPNNTGAQPYYNDKIMPFIAIFVGEGNTGNPPAWEIELDWDIETSITINTISQCDPTEAKVYFINEAASRTIESITSDKIRFYSTFFGRVDSQPYSLPDQTCAGLFAISNGLNVRRKLLKDGTQPGFFVSLEDLFDNLNAVWNIGMTIDPDINRPGFNRLRFEDWRFFYQEEVGLIFNYPTKINRSVDKSRVFNRLKIGYNKWTGGQYTGLDEFMTMRNYRANINAASQQLDATTDIIAAPYTWEITRRLDTGTEDWQYDNDIFGICLKGEGTPVSYSVETFTDAAYSVENVIDPGTCYNGRISPVRMAMRWFNWFMQGIRNLQADSRLIFTSGEANYIAKFGLDNCNIESKEMQENEDIDPTDFDDPQDAKPPLFPETLTFEHPLNFNLFKQIKNDPTLKFKSILVNCSGSMLPAWIKSISYKPEEGQATIVAIPKNNSILPDIPEPIGCQASIVNGSLTMTGFDWEAGTARIDFTEGNTGATLWSYIVTKGPNPGSGPGFSGTTTEHPFTVSGLTPGQWSVFIAPYCSPDDIGINFGAGTFDLPAPPFKVEISGYLTNNGSNSHLVLTVNSIGGVPAPAGFSFQWGYCYVNTSIGSTPICRAYPGTPAPIPTNTMSFGSGQITVTQQSAGFTPGASYGYINKIVLYNLTGITSADIIKASGQSWTLDFE